MTELLERAIARLQALPESEQDLRLASRPTQPASLLATLAA